MLDGSAVPLSSRAKPRDLRLYGPVVEMFFDRRNLLCPSRDNHRRTALRFLFNSQQSLISILQ